MQQALSKICQAQQVKNAATQEIDLTKACEKSASNWGINQANVRVLVVI